MAHTYTRHTSRGDTSGPHLYITHFKGRHQWPTPIHDTLQGETPVAHTYTRHTSRGDTSGPHLYTTHFKGRHQWPTPIHDTLQGETPVAHTYTRHSPSIMRSAAECGKRKTHSQSQNASAIACWSLTICTTQTMVCVRVMIWVGTLFANIIYYLVFTLTRNVGIRQDDL